VAVLAVFAACAGPVEPASRDQSLAVDGPWVIPAETLAIGDTQYVEYTGAGPWVGESGCGGGLLPGTEMLREWLYQSFPQTDSIGGYSCRPIVGNESMMSVHGTGRAVDIMIDLVGGEADNELGDPIGNYLIEHAEEIGIQYIIWDRWKWNGSRSPGDKDGYYSGAHPHNDHLHVELSVAAANMELPWYQGDPPPPDLPPCGVVPATGGIVDDADLCARVFGPSAYWRVVQGEGFGGRLLWTDAFESGSPSNWAEYELDMAAAGEYELEYHSTAAYAVFDSVTYEINHAGQTTTLAVDQAGLDGWISLGRFQFAEGGQQSVVIYDNTGPVAPDQHIIFDALRLTPVSDDPDDPNDPSDPDDPSDPSDPDDPPSDPGSDPNPDVQGGGGITPGFIDTGCSVGAGGAPSSGTLGLILLAVLFAGRLRRRPVEGGPRQ